MSRALRTAAAAMLLLGSTGLALLAGELVARRWPGIKPEPRYFPGELADRRSPNFVADPHTGWRMRPDHRFERLTDGRTVVYRSNAQGFRADRDYDRGDARPAVAFIGDSFTFGSGVDGDSTYVELVQRAFPALAVYNLGMPGIGVDQMWMSVRHQAAPLHPRLLVVSFIDEDLNRSHSAYRIKEGFGKPRFLLDEDTLRPATPDDRPRRLVRGIARRSWLLGAWQATVPAIGRRWPVGDWWTLNAAILRAMAADARAMGADVVLVRLPRRTVQPPFPTMHALAAELGWAYVDLADAAVMRPPGIHLPTDAHINEAGHRFVADTLVRLIAGNASLSREAGSVAAPVPGRP